MPAGIFDDFLAIPQLGSDLGTRGMASIIKAGTSGGQISGRWVTEICGPIEWGTGRELISRYFVSVS